MNERLVEEIANAVLYEGYILYPYRASALKNRQRFNFGVVAPIDDAPAPPSAPATTTGEKSFLQTDCLVRGTAESVLNARVRFLQIVDRSIGRLVESVGDGRGDSQPTYAQVATLDVDGKVFRGWQEAVEREIRMTIPLGSLLGGPLDGLLSGPLDGVRAAPVRKRVQWAAENHPEPLRTAEGRVVGAIVRRKEMLCAELAVSGELIDERVFKITVRVSNVTPMSSSEHRRDESLMRSLVSTHAILQIDDGEWLSLVDPPADVSEHAASCHQVGLWPVLVGDAPDRDALLASPIILYDYPQIAPESAGEFCDGTEIDEMLVLRIMTMTDAEKLEMRQGDDRGRLMLERTERLSDEHMMRLHGVLRGLRPLDNEEMR